jgi:tyrocidine synthetase-3
VLGFDQVGIHNDFFEMGGHSLSAMQIIVRVERAMRVEVPVQKLFDLPTVAQLAAFITATQGM